MNLSTVLVRRLLRSSTRTDAEFKEPAEAKQYGPVERFRTQIRPKTFNQKNPKFTGDAPEYTHILCYPTPLNASQRLEHGDNVVGLPDGRGGFVTVDLVVEATKPGAHLPDPGIWYAYLYRNDDVNASV